MSKSCLRKSCILYILENTSMPNIYKIGYTKNEDSLIKRIKDLSRQTGVPTPFKLVCYFKIYGDLKLDKNTSVIEIDKPIHNYLKLANTSLEWIGKEYFKSNNKTKIETEMSLCFNLISNIINDFDYEVSHSMPDNKNDILEIIKKE